MKRHPLDIPIFAVALLAVLIMAGCLSPQQEQWTCDKAKVVYEAYRAAQVSGAVNDQQVIANARLAAAFLHAYCGWETPHERAVRSTAAIGPQASFDRHDVLVIIPPR